MFTKFTFKGPNVNFISAKGPDWKNWLWPNLFLINIHAKQINTTFLNKIKCPLHSKYINNKWKSDKTINLPLFTIVSAIEVDPGPEPNEGIRELCPPNELLCLPPTFHPLPSLLNVIDFESESETDKTSTHKKVITCLSKCQQLHAITDCTLPTKKTLPHTQRDLCTPAP